MSKPESEGVCRECGCTDEDCSGCIERTGVACSWVEADLCSACVVSSEAAPAAEGETPKVTRLFERCRYRPCPHPATSGAFVFPLDPPVEGKRWAFTLLCLRHGVEAVRRGARHMSWRPKPGDRAQGSVEYELRERWGEGGRSELMTSVAHRVWAGARAELRRQGNGRPTSEEIASESIEAAEALSL